MEISLAKKEILEEILIGARSWDSSDLIHFQIAQLRHELTPYPLQMYLSIPQIKFLMHTDPPNDILKHLKLRDVPYVKLPEPANEYLFYPTALYPYIFEIVRKDLEKAKESISYLDVEAVTPAEVYLRKEQMKAFAAKQIKRTSCLHTVARLRYLEEFHPYIEDQKNRWHKENVLNTPPIVTRNEAQDLLPHFRYYVYTYTFRLTQPGSFREPAAVPNDWWPNHMLRPAPVHYSKLVTKKIADKYRLEMDPYRQEDKDVLLLTLYNRAALYRKLFDNYPKLPGGLPDNAYLRRNEYTRFKGLNPLNQVIEHNRRDMNKRQQRITVRNRKLAVLTTEFCLSKVANAAKRMEKRISKEHTLVLIKEAEKIQAEKDSYDDPTLDRVKNPPKEVQEKLRARYAELSKNLTKESDDTVREWSKLLQEIQMDCFNTTVSPSAPEYPLPEPVKYKKQKVFVRETQPIDEHVKMTRMLSEEQPSTT